MTVAISGSVGRGGVNLESDVATIQEMLNRVPIAEGGPKMPLAVDGKVGQKTIDAIQQFQLHHFGWSIADGRVDPDGATMAKLRLWSPSPEVPAVPEFPSGPDYGGGLSGIPEPEIILASTTWQVESAPPPPALDPWAVLFNHRLKHHPQLSQYFAGTRSASPQELESGWDGVNVDCYAVRVDRWPKKDNGVQFSPSEFTQYVRLHINDFADGTFPSGVPIVGGGRLASFNMYDVSTDSPLWHANNGVNTLISIKMGDDGSVGVVAANGTQWIFKTLTTKNDGTHPVTGNRMFGVVPPGNTGEVWFGTRGVDRITDMAAAYPPVLPPWLLAASPVPAPLVIGRLLWRSFQNNLYSWINGHGGAATKIDPFEHVYDWSDIKKHYVLVTV